MIGVIFNSKYEFSEFLKFYNISNEYLQEYPYGEYYQTKINNKDIVFFRSGSKKVYAASSSQYMIDKFNLKKIICIGTCTQINDDLDYNDIIIPEFISEYDLTIREIEPLINENNIIELNIEDIDLDYFKGLPYYELNWGIKDQRRVMKPELKVRKTQSINSELKRIIRE